ncbi:hypothetical protein VE26_00105, partial [Devosia chinhatensis]
DANDVPRADRPASGPTVAYTPSNTLGGKIAAQLDTAMRKDIRKGGTQKGKGEFADIKQWRGDRVWKQASGYATPDLINRATGEPLNADHFKAHLRTRYGA